MSKLYGSLIFFFYFLKYPIIIYLAICYYSDIPTSFIIDILGTISIVLIFKDLFSLLKKIAKKKS